MVRRLIEALLRRLNNEQRRYGVNLSCDVCEAWMDVTGADEEWVNAHAKRWEAKHAHPEREGDE